MWTCCINRHAHLGVCALARTCLHTAGLVYAYGDIFVVFSRCNAAGRIYMASKTGSYYQYPLTRVCFSVHLHVYSPVNKEAKFILWPLYVTAFQRQLGLDSNSANMSFTACKLCPPYCLFCCWYWYFFYVLCPELWLPLKTPISCYLYMWVVFFSRLILICLIALKQWPFEKCFFVPSCQELMFDTTVTFVR